MQWVDLDQLLADRVPDRQRRAGRPTAAASSIRCRTASSTWLDLNIARLERRGARRRCSARRPRPGSNDERRADVAEGRIVPLGQRALRLEASLSLQGRWHARPRRSPAASGTSARSTASTKANGWVYFSGTERSYIGGDVYRIKLDGTRPDAAVAARRHAPRQLQPGLRALPRHLERPEHAAAGARAQGRRQRGAAWSTRARFAQLAEFALSKPELLQVKTRDGFVMEAMLIKPADFDPARKYPVMQFTYGGPGAASVAQRAGAARRYMYYQLLAQNGRRRLGLRQPARPAARARSRVAKLQELRRARAARRRGRARLSEASSRGSTRRASASTAGASAASWSPTR